MALGSAIQFGTVATFGERRRVRPPCPGCEEPSIANHGSSARREQRQNVTRARCPQCSNPAVSRSIGPPNVHLDEGGVLAMFLRDMEERGERILAKAV